MRVDSLAFRLFVTSAIWTLLVLPIAGVIIYSLYKDDFQTSFDGQLQKLVTAITIDSMLAGAEEPIPPKNRYEPLFEVTHSGWYWQIKPIDDPKKRMFVSASLATATLPSPYDRKLPADDTGTRWMNADGPVGEPIRVVEVVETLGNEIGKPRYSIIVAGPLDWFEASVSKFRNRLTTALTIAGLGLVIVTLFQVRFGLLPLRKIEKGLAEIRSGNAQKLEGSLPAEIEPLQHELNALLKSNQDVVDRARTQVGNLAHALKTPLAVITNEAREMRAAVGEKIIEQAQIMRDQLGHYLDRARMAARVGVIGHVTEVRPVINSLTRALERIYRDKGVEIHITCPASIKFLGEKQDLEEMLGNLLDNACKWADQNVYLSVDKRGRTSKTSPARMYIKVEDDGPGLKPEERAKICKRGIRLDESKPGSGLGLSIVTDVAQSYRGQFDLDQSTHGGLMARLELPAV